MKELDVNIYIYIYILTSNLCILSLNNIYSVLFIYIYIYCKDKMYELDVNIYTLYINILNIRYIIYIYI